MDILERFAPLMAAALHYAGSAEGLATPLETIQKQLLALAEEERAMPFATADSDLLEVSEERRRELEDARFAVYAWSDEKLLNAQRPDAGGWLPFSLQCHYFSTTEAGQHFYTRLSDTLDKLGIASIEHGVPLDLEMRLELARCSTTSTDGLRVFALCLLYGFTGHLYGQKEMLSRVRKTCFALLRRTEILPQPRAITTKREGSYPLLQWLEPVAYVVVPVAVCALFWLYCADIMANIPVKGF